MLIAAEITIAFAPIILFLVFLGMMDSFQLVKKWLILAAIGTGIAVAIMAIFVNSSLQSWLGLSPASFSRFVAPVSEESLKILLIVYLVSARKIGFMVDAAILGFAVGAGFAIMENLYYMNAITEAGLLTWFVRGFGTAIMHGGTTAIAAVISKSFFDRKEWPVVFAIIPGLLAAILLHALFNMFLFPPLTSALVILLDSPAPVRHYIQAQRTKHKGMAWHGPGFRYGNSPDFDGRGHITIKTG